MADLTSAIDLTSTINDELLRSGANMVGFGNITEIAGNVCVELPIGVSVAVAYPKEVIRGIADLPTLEYREWYDKLNKRLDAMVTHGAEMLRARGYRAVAQTLEYVERNKIGYNTLLPHKTVATRAGIGWIGKSALLVTEEYGSAIRLSSILTDAPLHAAQPITESRCGDCMVCTNACPAGAVSGRLWEMGLYRDEFFDPVKCSKTARERSKRGFGGEITICGKCIEVCPHTRRFIEKP